MTNQNQNNTNAKLEAIEAFKSEAWAIKRMGEEIGKVKDLFRLEEFRCFDRHDFESLMKWVKEEVYRTKPRKFTLKKVMEDEDGCIMQVVGWR